MARFLLTLLAVFSTASSTRAQSAGTVPGPLLRIDAVALDDRGNPVMDLRKDELEVRIANYRVPIETVTVAEPGDSDRRGRVIALLLDDAIVPLSLTPRVREIARRFVDRMMPADRMAIIELNGKTTELTGDRGRLLASIKDYNVRTIGYPPRDQVGAHVLNSITTLSRQLAEAATGRKAIVGIGAAWLFDTPIPPSIIGGDVRREWTAAVRAAAFANIALYAIEPGGVGTSRFGGSDGFASETGGRAFVNTNDFDRAVDQVMRETGSYYVLEVADPPVQRKADLRKLEVRVHRKGVTIQARREFPGTEVPPK